MPFMAQEEPVSPLSKLKRRREDSGDSFDNESKLSRQAEAPDDIMWPSSHRHAQTLEPAPIFSANLTEEAQPMERRHIHPKLKRPNNSKRKRLSVNALQQDPSFTRESSGHSLRDQSEMARNANSQINLNPCHICRRRPTVKSELDQYADCEGCGRRACYICIRECLGSPLAEPPLGRYDMDGDYDVLASSTNGVEWFSDARTKNGRQRMDSGYEGEEAEDGNKTTVWEEGLVKEHRRKICSRCCVEKGKDGEVWCLGCLRMES